MMGYTIIGWIGPLIMSGLCWALFRKAGLRGGIFAVTLLPFTGMIISTFLNVFAAQGFIAGDVSYFVVSSLIGIAFYIAPLIVLLTKDWPGKADDDVFK